MVADCRIHIEVTDPVIRTVSFTLSLIVLAYFVRGAVSVDATGESQAWSGHVHHPMYSQCLLSYMSHGGDSEQDSYIEDCLEGFPDYDFEDGEDYVDPELDMDVVGGASDSYPLFPPKAYFEDQKDCPPGVLGTSLGFGAVCVDGIWIDEDHTSTSTTTPIPPTTTTPPPSLDIPEKMDMDLDQERDGTLLALQLTLPIICFGVFMFIIYLGLPYIKGFLYSLIYIFYLWSFDLYVILSV